MRVYGIALIFLTSACGASDNVADGEPFDLNEPSSFDQTLYGMGANHPSGLTGGTVTAPDGRVVDFDSRTVTELNGQVKGFDSY